MTRKFLTMVSLLVATVWLPGCGPDCVASCEAVNGCPGAQATDCGASCERAERINELASCEDQHSDFLSCIERQEDICRTAAQCEVKGEQYLDCVAGYCVNHPQDCQ